MYSRLIQGSSKSVLKHKYQYMMMNEPSLCQHGLTDRTATPVTTSYSTNCAVKYEFYLFISRKPTLSHLLSGCASSPSSLSVYYFPSSRKSSLHSIIFPHCKVQIYVSHEPYTCNEKNTHIILYSKVTAKPYLFSSHTQTVYF